MRREFCSDFVSLLLRGFEQQLDFRQVVLRIAYEDHAWAFDVDFARRERGRVRPIEVRGLPSISSPAMGGKAGPR